MLSTRAATTLPLAQNNLEMPDLAADPREDANNGGRHSNLLKKLMVSQSIFPSIR